MAVYGNHTGMEFLPLNKKYRGHFEIIALVLEAARDGAAAPFSIMQYASVNCSQLKKYINVLIELGFVEMGFSKSRVFYRTSSKGLEFLRQYNVLLGMLFTGNQRNKLLHPINGYSSEFQNEFLRHM